MQMNRIDIRLWQSESKRCKRVLQWKYEFMEKVFGDVISPNMLFLWKNMQRKYVSRMCGQSGVH